MSSFRTTGIVLRTVKLGEYDRIITFITPDHGRIKAVAKGVRKTTSRVSGRVELGSWVNIQIFRGRGELHRLSQVETIDTFPVIRGDFDRINSSFGLLDAIDQVVQEETASQELMEMLVGALKWLDNKEHDPELVVASFYLKLLSKEGAAPIVDRCARCGDEEASLVAFDYSAGGLLCNNCRSGRAVPDEVATAMRAILGGGLGTILLIKGYPFAKDLELLATEALELHLDRRLKSAKILRATGHI
ncbi:MAG: DNA repair protein RecO [Acidimicrobiales bacterium]|nr:DNA repair protein RecO [Acidimicrobiales bacterium]